MQPDINRQIVAFRRHSWWGRHTNRDKLEWWRPAGMQIQTSVYWQLAKRSFLWFSLHSKSSSPKLRSRKEHLWYTQQAERHIANCWRFLFTRNRSYWVVATAGLAFRWCDWDRLHAGPCCGNRRHSTVAVLRSLNWMNGIIVVDYGRRLRVFSVGWAVVGVPLQIRINGMVFWPMTWLIIDAGAVEASTFSTDHIGRCCRHSWRSLHFSVLSRGPCSRRIHCLREQLLSTCGFGLVRGRGRA